MLQTRPIFHPKYFIFFGKVKTLLKPFVPITFQIFVPFPMYNFKIKKLMKNIISLVFAGMIGGLITFSLIQYNTDDIKHVSPAQQATVVSNSTMNSLPFDFSLAAEVATPAVVHIRAAESELLARQRMEKQRRNNPFRSFEDLFDLGQSDLFFGHPFQQRFYQKKGSGSGVIISEDGYIVTNNHVVGFADDIIVTLFDGRQMKGEVIGSDPNSDLAVVKIEETGLPTLEYADSDKAKVGEWVLAVGNPFDYLTSTATAGIISAKGRDINIIKEDRAIEEFIQTDAAINPGNSGGALVDKNGKLLGINTAIATKTGYYSGYSFAIPVNLMVQIVDDIIKYGNFQRAQLGVQVDNLDEDYVRMLGLDNDQGVVVTDVFNGGSAQFAGIIPNDVIIEANGVDISNYDELATVVNKSRVGDTLELKIIRDGQKKQMPVRLKKGI